MCEIEIRIAYIKKHVYKERKETTSGVHLTHLIGEIVKTTTKVSLHLLKLHHDGLESHTNNCRGRRSWGKGWNSRSYRIGCLHSWPLRSKLSLTPSNRTNVDGTHNGEKRRERDGNVKMCEDTHDSRKEGELIMCSSVLIHIYDRCDEVRGKVNEKILHQGKKKTSTTYSDGVIVRPWSETEGHHVQKAKAFSKAWARVCLENHPKKKVSHKSER